MDPDATLRVLEDCTLGEVRAHAEFLRGWLDGGGFQPNWLKNPRGSRRFFAHLERAVNR